MSKDPFTRKAEVTSGAHRGHLMLLDAAVTALLMTHPRPEHLRRDFEAISKGIIDAMADEGIAPEVIALLERRRKQMLAKIGATAVRPVR